eukprot:2174053-Rhodomonas_salina.1
MCRLGLVLLVTSPGCSHESLAHVQVQERPGALEPLESITKSEQLTATAHRPRASAVLPRHQRAGGCTATRRQKDRVHTEHVGASWTWAAEPESGFITLVACPGVDSHRTCSVTGGDGVCGCHQPPCTLRASAQRSQG